MSSLEVDGAANLDDVLNVAKKATFSENIQVIGAAQLDSTLAVAGAATLSSTLAVTGAATLSDSLSVGAATNLLSTLNVTGATVLSDTLSVAENASFAKNVTITGNLNVMGQQTIINTETMEIEDNAILLAKGNNADVMESGLMIQYKPNPTGPVNYAGIKRLPQSGEFVFFKDAKDQIADNTAPTQGHNVYGEWFGMDLGSQQSIAEIGVCPNYNNEAFLRSWTIAGSNNETDWYFIDSKANIPSDIITPFVFPMVVSTLSSPVSYRYLRVIIQNNTDGALQIAFPIYIKDTQGNFLSIDASYHPSSAGIEIDPSLGVYQSLSSATVDALGISFNAISNYDALYVEGEYKGDEFVYVIGAPDTSVYAVVIADSFNCASDQRLKKNIVPIDGALEKLDHIRGVYHDWIAEDQPQDRQIGVIAQEVQAVYPELVREGGNGYLSVNYPKLTAVLLQSIKELKAMVIELAKKQA